LQHANIVSIQVGLPRTLGREDALDPAERLWTTGIFKSPVAGAVWLGRLNLAGDGQADLKAHGGPHKAVCVYPAEHYSLWRAELSLSEMSYGSFGENFTTQGLLEGEVCIGDVFAVGTASVEVSQPRSPCRKLARRWQVSDMVDRVLASGRTGWYLRVLREGEVRASDELVLMERSCPEWTIERATRLMHRDNADRDAALALSACPALAPGWRESLARRLKGNGPENGLE
jgi:MOSC domain-containing protein YiiM